MAARPPRAHNLIADVWGTAVRDRRRELGLTQVGLAEAMGVSQPTISEVETGNYRALTPELVLKFCVALDVEPSRLFAWPPGIGSIARYESEAMAS